MSYSSPATQSTGAVAPATWANSVKAATDYLANPPSCRVYNSAAIAVASSSLTALTFNSERWKTVSGMHSNVTHSGRITIPDAGLYLLTAYVAFAANASGFRQVAFRVDGTTFVASDKIASASGSQETDMAVSATWKFAAGQYVECLVQQTSGGSLNVIVGGSYSPEFGATWIGTG